MLNFSPTKKRVYMFIMSFLIFSIFILLFSCSSMRNFDFVFENWAYQLQDAKPDEIASSGFEIVVMDYSKDGTDELKYTAEEIERIKNVGTIPIAYLSIGEAENYRFYWKDEWYNDPPEWLGRENESWNGNYAVKYWYDGWKKILFSYLDRIISQGFMGVYLDKVDEFEYWSSPDNDENFTIPEEDAAEKMIDLIVEISDYCEKKTNGEFYIIPQNGERILEYDNGRLVERISGWGVEDLFYRETNPVPSKLVEERKEYLDSLLRKGKFILSVDYVDDGSGYVGENKMRIDDYFERARDSHYTPYAAISDRELDELNVIEGVQP